MIAHRDVRETNIFGSDIVSSEFIQKSIDGVGKDCRVKKLEVEDLVTSETHQQLLPSIKELVLSRHWESVKFIDFVSDSESYQLWRWRTKLLMQDYDASDHAEVLKICTFQACCCFQAGTKLTGFLQVLKDIHFNDQSICGLEYEGDFTGDGSYKCVSNALQACISQRDLCLSENISLRIVCGWSDVIPPWKPMLAECMNIIEVASKGTKKKKKKKEKSKKRQASLSDTCSVSSSSTDGMIANERSKCIHRGGAPDYDWKAGCFTLHMQHAA
jgi:hypothetical protein